MLYELNFIGRQKGALGVSSLQTVKVHANSKQDALESLYKDYEHIRLVSKSEMEIYK